LLNVISGLFAGGVAASTTSYESISTVTLGSTQATIEFTGIAGTYKHLQIRGISRDSSASYSSNDLVVQLNSDTASNYSWHRLYGTGSAAAADSAANASYMLLGQESTSLSGASMFGGTVINILDYANTSKYKTARSLSGIDLNGGTDGRIMFQSGSWRSTSAVSSVLLKPVSGSFVQYSSFALYGIKG
jgi:hypothetical protein